MKIDLHVHTKKTKKDSKNRDIDSKSFCSKMRESNVGIVAITNHNFFDEKQYEEINKIIKLDDQQLLVLPGVEVDVLLNLDSKIEPVRKQMNIIFPADEDKKKEFLNFYHHFENDFNDINLGHIKGIKIDKIFTFISQNLKNIKIFFYLDRKHGKTSFNDKEISECFDTSVISENKNICIVNDINRYKDYMFFVKANKNSLIGSDNCDWDSYVKESEKLLEYNILIDSFDKLFYVFKNGESFDTFEKMKLCIKFDDGIKISKKTSNSSENNDENYYTIKNLKILKKTVNVIFGPKSSGKSALLKSIYDSGEIGILKNIFIPKDTKDFLNSYKKDDYFAEKKSVFSEKFKKMLEFKEEIVSFPNFRDWARQKSSTFLKLSEIEPPSYLNTNVEIKDNVKSLIGLLNKSKKEIEVIKDNGYEEDIKKLEEILEKYIYCWIQIKKNESFWKINKEIHELLKKVQISKKNKIPKPTNMNLKEKFKNRLDFYRNLSYINENFFKKKDDFLEYITKFTIPNGDGSKKEIQLKYKLIFKYNTNTRSNKFSYSKALYKLIDKYCDKFEFINPRDFCDSKHAHGEDYIKFLKEEINGNDSFHFIEKDDKNYVFFSENSQIDLSKGEIHFLNLNNFLEENKHNDYYFLDEPETSLNNHFISTAIFDILHELVQENKTIVMTTHNSVLGINTKPMNYIFRDNKKEYKNHNYETYIGNIQEKYLIETETNKPTKISIRDKLLEYFEGDTGKYKYRKEIYDIKDKVVNDKKE